MISIVLHLLVSVITAQMVVFENATIQISTVSGGVVYDDQYWPDTCKDLVAMNNQIYHSSKVGVFQSFLKGDLGVHTFIRGTTTLEPFTFGITEAESSIILIQQASSGNAYLYTVNPTTFNGTFSHKITVTPFPAAVSMKGPLIVTLTVDTTISYIKVLNKSNGNIIRSANFPVSFKRMEVTPDFTKALLWTQLSQVLIVRLSDLVNLTLWSPPVPLTTPNSTNRVAISKDSTLAIIETDNFNPVYVIDLNSFAVVQAIPINQIIYQVSFLDAEKTLMVIFGNSSLIIVDLLTHEQFNLSAISATSYASDQMGKIYTCVADSLCQKNINFTRTGLSERAFFMDLEKSEGEEIATVKLNSSLNFASGLTNSMATVASSVPFSIFFLGFLNYFTMCSLYVLLNFPLPETLYRYLSLVYNQINANFFAVVGIEFEVPPLSIEKKSKSNKARFFGVSSDLSNHLAGFVFIAINIAFILLIQFLTSFLRNNNALRKFVDKEKWEMLCGHIINAMAPLILPWTFILLDAGVRNFKTKINTAGNFLIFFMGFVFPIYYLFELLQDRQNQIIRERKKECQKLRKLYEKQESQPIKSPSILETKKRKISQSLELDTNPTITKKQEESFHSKSKKAQSSSKENPSPKPKIKIFISSPEYKLQQMKKEQQKKRRKLELEKKVQKLRKKDITLKELLTGEIAEQWHLCQANFVLPCLVLLSNPIYFLIVICLYSFLGIVIAFKKKDMRVNSLILAIYPFIFHICFMFLYWSQHNKVLVYAELVCLGTFLLGSVHHCLTLIFIILAFLVKAFKQCCKSNQINPKDQPNEELSKNIDEKKEEDKKSNILEVETIESKKTVSIHETLPKEVKTKKTFREKNHLKVNFTKKEF